MAILKGMSVLIDGKIVNRYVYLKSLSDYRGVIRIDKDLWWVVKSAEPMKYQWVFAPYILDEIDDEMLTIVGWTPETYK